MTDILCRWLNEDVKLSRIIDPTNIAKEFSTGYLLGELLNKHGLQEDFSFFSQNITSDSKLHNFTRLEPTLKLLEVPYDTNVARAVMNENHSAITRLMYQLFIALGKKSKAGLTGIAMETMRPSGPVKLESIESGLYKERLKQLTKRQVDLNFEQLVQRYQAKQKEQEEMAFKAKFQEEERMKKYLQGQRQQGLDKSRQMKQKQLEMMDKIRDATVKIPKPPESKKTAKTRAEIRRHREAEEVKESIDAFEASLRAVIPPASPIGFEGDQSKREMDSEIDAFLGSKSPKKPVDPLSYIKPSSNDDYINKIRTRLEEDSVARKEREKRRRRVLIEQMKAHEAQEEAHREEMLVNRLMRQSQQERRIAVQLMQVRHEKEVIRQNRIFREKQYAERRLKDFDDALTREAELCRQAKIEYAEETRKAQELQDKIKGEIAEEKYNKHYNICWEVLSQIVDFSCKIGEYRELTEKLIPPKMFREWKALFLEGLPIYEDEPVDLASNNELAKLREIEKEKEDLMDEGDFLEYKNLIGEWTPVDEAEIKGPPKDNAVLGHIIHRLFNIVSPPEPPPPPPEFPPFPIKVCFLGKFFSGKTSTINKVLDGHRMVRLSVDDLVAEAVDAFKNCECIEEPAEESAVPDEDSSPKKVSIEDQPAGQSQATTPQSAAVEEGTGERKENEDPNKLEEKQANEAGESEEKRDKTKEELEKESPEVKEDEKKTPSKSKEQEHAVSKTKEPMLTTRAKLGSKAYGFLKKGKATPDQLLVDIMVESVRQVPEGTGWIMDGFPGTINQAKLLEKALSGYDAQKEAKDAKAGKDPSKVGKTKKSRLAPDPHPAAEALTPKSGIDLVLLFDLPDDIALKRAEGRTYDPSSAKQYHQEYNPPVEGSYTGMNKQDKVVPVTDPSNDREQVQQRIVGFLDAWPKLDKWFTKFGILQQVDANTSQEELYDQVSASLNETFQRLIAPPEEVPSEPSILPGQTVEGEPTIGAPTIGAPSTQGDGHPTEGLGSESAAVPPESVPPPSEAPSEAGAKSENKSEKGTTKSKGDSKPGSPKSRKSKKDRSPSPQASKKGTKSRSPTPPSSKKGSRSGSKSPSASRKGSRPGSKGSRPGSKRAKSPKKGAEELEEEKPPEPQGPPEPEPGSEDWVYVDQPIEVDFAGVLTTQWEILEETYIDSCKKVFGEIRRERELIHRYFYGTRKYFVEFLKRPDEKQEYVLQWQKSYNEVAEDTRGDEDTKAELHQQLDDLCDRLHDICDYRKELAEKERQSVMNEGWLEDRLGLLTNFYVTLMQAEVDRYQDTERLLRDYYVGMEGKIPTETISEYARLPLVELPLTVRPLSASSKSGGSESATNLATVEKTEVKSPSGRKDKDKGTTKTPEPVEPQEEEQKSRIPLVPRRPKSGEPGAGRGKDKKGDKKKGQAADTDKPETPVPPSDPDEKLVFDAYIVALTIIETMALIDQTEQEAEAVRQAELEKEKEREAIQKKTKEKKEKKGRKSSTKGGSTYKTESPLPPPTDEQEGQSEEEQLKQKTKERARKEFLGAVASEDNGLKIRLEMINNHAIAVLQELKGKADSTYKDMDDWLGERFLQEVESIKEMAENIRFAIEKEEKLQDEVLLKDKDFLIDLDTRTFKTPTPPPPPSPVEVPLSDTFTVSQLFNLYRQLAETAPTGVISNRAFCDTIMDMTALTYGMELLPDSWMNITQQQLQDVCTVLSLETEFIDWRRFLLAAAQPWTPASKMDLLMTLERCREVDTTFIGRLTHEEFEQVDLWFYGQQELEHPKDPDVPPVFDRQGKLKNAFFQIFADHDDDVPSLDYVDMLLYFAADPDPLEGFLRGLSVVANQPMPSSKSLVHLPQPMTEDYGGDVNVPQIQEPQSPPPEMDSLVTLENLMKAFHHGEGRMEDTHRMSLTADPDDAFARERLAGVFVELGAEETEAVPFHLLYQHPIIQDCMHMCQRFKTIDLRNSFKSPLVDSFE